MMLPSLKTIFHQPPGTGKTRSIVSFVYLYANEEKDAKILFSRLEPSLHLPPLATVVVQVEEAMAEQREE